MFKSYIQNTKDISIYEYIKNINPDLYKVIKLCGAKHYFKQSNITFLMPTNEKLLNKIISSEPKQSLDILKHLLINKVLTNLSDFSSNLYNLYGFKLNNPSSLPIRIDPNWKLNKYCAIFLYNGEDIPEYVKVSSTEKISTTKKLTPDFKIQKHKEVLDKYKKYVYNNCNGINPFVEEIANILSIIKNNESKYLEVCELLDNNAIISWFIIMQLGLEENPVLPQELFKLKTIDHPDPYNEYNEAFEKVPVIINKQNWFKNVSIIRKKLVNHFDISLPEQIVKAYNNNYIKLLQDEIRFKYRNIKDYFWTDIVEELELIDWNYPQNHIIFGNEELCKYLIEDDDKFYSGPVKFIKSIYFMYKPLNKKFYLQIVETTKKSCEDPYTNGIVYGDQGDRIFDETSKKEERRGYNVKSVWNSFNKLEKEQMKEFLQTYKINNKEDVKKLWNELNDEQKNYIKELSS